jgi:hypothetical protein
MSDISKLRAAANEARDRHDHLLEQVRLGVHVEQQTLGDANRAFTSAQALLNAELDAEAIRAEGRRILALDEASYQRERASQFGSVSPTII